MSAKQPAAKEIFLTAVEKSDRVDRADYLDQACAGDPELRQRVEALLAAHDAAGSFLASQSYPAGTATLAPRSESVGAVTEHIGQVIAGRYTLAQKLGEGGMGSVWVAEQTEPVKRRVALKMIRAGLGTHAVLRRFEAERQALALMDHPNIAKILDGGEAATGQPFFVMELVKGVPITRYCDELHLTIRDRLKLFGAVCHAIQHAHQKGIIHRDIKPGNVLVAVQDGMPTPKVIDFGVAKALNQRLTEETMNTQIGAVVGTLEYMSPEQAELSELDIDTRADIYALGVLLYELLTGTTPINKSQMKDAAIFEMLRMIKQDEPPKPSTRLTESKESLASLAAQRRTDPTRLTKEVRGELDWIVMKCLDKDRTRRYESASNLARDVERYLADDAVEAGPPTVRYRAGKFLRRHKAPVLAAILLLLFLVGGIVGTSWGFIGAEQARKAEAKQRALAEKNEKKAVDEATRADTARTLAETSKEETRRHLYVAKMNLIQRAYEVGNIAQVQSLLLDLVPKAGEEDLRGFEWHYWNRMSHRELLTCKPPQGLEGSEQILVAFSPDGRRLARASATSVAILNATTGEQIDNIKLPAPLVSLAFSRNGRNLAGGGEVPTLNEPPGSPEDAGGKVYVWDVASRKLLHTLKGHWGAVSCVAFTADDRWLASAGGRGDGTIRIWDTTTGKELLSFNASSERFGVSYVSFSPDSHRLVSIGEGNALVWDTSTGKQIREFVGPTHAVLAAAFSADGHQLLSLETDGALRRWDTVSWQQVGEKMLRTNGDIYNAVLSPDGRRLVAIRQIGTVMGWDVNTGKQVYEVKGPDSTRSLAFSPDGRRIATGCADGTVQVWDAVTGQENLGSDPEYCFNVAFSPDGVCLAAGRYFQVCVLDSTTGQELQVHSEAFQRSWAVFNADGHLASEDLNRKMHVWDPYTGKDLHALELDCPDYGRIMALSSDGRRLAEDNFQGTIRVLDFATGKRLHTFKSRDAELGDSNTVSFSPDGTRLAFVGNENSAKVLEVESGKELVTLRGHTNQLTSVAFSTDGSRLATGSYDGTARVWDAATGKPLMTLSGHVGLVNCVAFIPRDDNRLVSGGWDGTVRLWDLRTGQELLSFKSEQFVSSVTFSPDGRRLAAGGQAGVRIWDAFSVPEEVWSKRAMVIRVNALFEEMEEAHDARAEVLARLDKDSNLNDDERKFAATVARAHRGPNATRLCDQAREVVLSDGRAKEEYARALRQVEAALRLVPGNSRFATVKGMAQYRLGQYPAALETLTQSLKANTNPSGLSEISEDLAFLAMTQFQIGQKEDAKKTLAQLREVAKGPLWRMYLNDTRQREAQELIEGRVNGKKP